MGVEREEVLEPGFVGSALPVRIVRGASGSWTVEFLLDITVDVGDGRKVRVQRQIRVRANGQIGRKRASAGG